MTIFSYTILSYSCCICNSKQHKLMVLFTLCMYVFPVSVVGKICSSLPCLKTGSVLRVNSMRTVLPQWKSVMDSLPDRPEIYQKFNLVLVGLFCPIYSKVCSPLLLYSEWFCGDVQPTDQVSHWPLVLVGISGSFCAKAWDAFFLMKQILSERVDWGRGGISQELQSYFEK